MNPNIDALFRFEASLAAHFAKLRLARGQNSVFLIEHGLDAAHIEEMQALVGRNLREVGLASAGWRGATLPLAVSITEVGYNYRGTGTDFWPKASAALNADIHVSDRAAISRIFSDLSNRLGFSRPFKTDWALAYNHIAWPIRNALAPIEIHRSLVAALGQVLSSGTSLREDDDLHAEMRSIANGLFSKRLADWLEDRNLALALSRRLLLGEDHQSWLEPVIANRIAEDLRADPQARRSLTSARRLVSRERMADLEPPAPGKFLLSVSDGKVHRVVLQGPAIQVSGRARMLALFKNSCDVVVPGAVGKALQLEEFLQGGLMDLGQPLSPFADPVLTFVSSVPLIGDIEVLSDALQPDNSMVFEWHGTDGLLNSLQHGSEIFAHRTVLILSWTSLPDHDELSVLESWPGANVYVLDAASQATRHHLRRLGIAVIDVPAVAFGGGVSLFQSDTHIRSIAGIPVFCRSARSLVSVSVRSDDDAVLVAEDLRKGEIVPLNFGFGRYAINVRAGDKSWQYTLDILEPSDAVPFGFRIEPELPQLEDLFSDSLSIAVASPLVLERVTVSAALRLNGELVAEAKIILGSVPARIGPRSDLLRDLKEAALRNADISDSSELEFRVSIPGLVTRNWHLGRATRSYTFDPKKLTWQAEEGPEINGYLLATVGAPLLTPMDAPPQWPAKHLMLLAPQTDTDDALSCCIVAAPPVLHIGPPEAVAGLQLLRSDQSRAAGHGLIALSEALVAWRSASPSNIFADLNRGLVVAALELGVVQQLCGRNWRHIEESGDGLKGNALDALVSICFRRNLAVGGDFPDIQPEEYPVLRQFLRHRLGEALPDLVVAMAEGVSFESLDFAIMDAYEDLSADRLARGLESFDDIDIGFDTEIWRMAISDALTSVEKPRFKPLVLPEDRWSKLSRLDYSAITQDGVIDALAAAHVDVSRRAGVKWLGRKEFRSGLQLWLSPRELLATTDWRDDLTKLLSDRQTARAIRYAALRLIAEMQSSAL
jgi:hypothetical protein